MSELSVLIYFILLTKVHFTVNWTNSSFFHSNLFLSAYSKELVNKSNIKQRKFLSCKSATKYKKHWISGLIKRHLFVDYKRDKSGQVYIQLFEVAIVSVSKYRAMWDFWEIFRDFILVFEFLIFAVLVSFNFDF